MKDNIEQITEAIVALKKLNQLSENITSVASELSQLTYQYKNPLSESAWKRKMRLNAIHGHGSYKDKLTRTYLEDLKDIIAQKHECLIASLADSVKRSRVIDHCDQSTNEDTSSSE